MNIETLRSLRSKSMTSITNGIEKISNPTGSYEDDRIWKLEADKAGNATAIIRFLPATIKETDSDDVPFVRIYSHGFQGPSGRWFIEQCLTSIGEDCPVCSENSKLWAKGDDESKRVVRDRRRKTRYYSNVLIISDPKNPENEGKVKLFSYGTKIFDKIKDKINPTFEDEQPVNVFDYWEGANFKIRQRKVEGYPNYDQSQFLESTAIGTDDYILEISKQQHLLNELIKPSEFMPFDAQARKLNEVIGSSDEQPRKTSEIESVKTKIQTASSVTVDDNDDDTLEYFRKIANEG